jgi:hypothetical protein
MTEAVTLVGVSEYLRSSVRSEGRTRKPVLLDNLSSIRHYIPGTSRYEHNPSGLLQGYLALLALAAAGGALACFLVGRRYAYSAARSTGWVLAGILFGWVGLALMIVVHNWPALIVCPQCRKLRVVTRDQCEHCGALHATPAADGTEIFDSATVTSHVALATIP